MSIIAKKFLEAGYGILPLKGVMAPTHNGAKAPLVKGGSRGATWYPDPLPDLPGEAYGVYAAPGVIILDIDNKPGKGTPDGFSTLESMPGYSEPDLDTFTVATPGGGLHLYFTGEGVPSGNGASLGLSGIDIRSDDGRFYTLGPGSKTPDGEYRVVNDRDLAPVPGWLRSRLLVKTPVVSAAVEPVLGKEMPDKQDLRKLTTAWRKRGEKGARMASCLKMALAGQPYEDRGAVRDTTRDICYWLARERPNLDPSKLVDHVFEPAWQTMYEPFQRAAERGGGGIETDFHRSWKTALEKIAAERATRAARRNEVIKQRIYAARWGETSEPYSESELQTMADWLDIERDLLGSYLVCGSPDGRVWFLGLDRDGHPTYRGPVKGGMIVPRARDLLAPFGGLASVETFDEGKGAYVLIDSNRLLQTHGFTVSGVISSFYGSSRVDWKDELLVERVAAYARVEPMYNAEIDTWLRALCGDAYGAVMDWVSTCGDLSQAAPSLWFVGANGIGKSLIALGVSKLFGRDKPVNGNHMKNFNGGLKQCPVLEFEEFKRLDVEEFKALVTAASTEVESKGVDRCLIRGALRICCSFNNFNMFETQRGLTAEDCSALEDRVILVHSKLPQNYLPKETAVGWIENGDLVSHMKWIVDNHVPKESNRLACRPYAKGLKEQLLGGNTDLQEAGELLFNDMRNEINGLDRCVFKAPVKGGEDVLLIRPGELTKQERGWNARRFNAAFAATGAEKSVVYTTKTTEKSDAVSRRYTVMPMEDFKKLCKFLDEDWEELWGNENLQRFYSAHRGG